MLPIHKLLSRIRWDREFGRSAFVIGYYDRVVGRIIRAPFSEVIMEEGEGHALQVMGDDGLFHTVPLHRIREVYKDGELIWQRPGGAE
jgi:uncharacterized protein (UPF0248 family)